MTFIHNADLKKLQQLASDMPQSLLFTGPTGIGLTGIAKELATIVGSKLIIIQPEKDDKIDLVKGAISVEMIRRLYDMTRTRQTTKQLIVIDEVDRMSPAAQNAFLKLLEEPNERTYFILLSHAPGRLLPTIKSRVTRVDFHPTSVEQSNELLDELKVSDATKRSQLLFIAGGLPAELTRFAGDDALFQSRSQVVRDARTVLQGTMYEKLVIANTYKDRREDSLVLLSDAGKLLKQTMTATKDTNLVLMIPKLLESYDHIEANGNVRLWLARAVV